MAFRIQKAVQPDPDYLTLADLCCGAEENRLNKRSELKEIRRGPIWDDAVRVSLMKHIISQGEIK